MNPWISSPLLSKCAGVIHGFGLSDFSLNDYLKSDISCLKSVIPYPKSVIPAKAGIQPLYKFYKTNQMHSDNIVVLSLDEHRKYEGKMSGDDAPQETDGAEKIEADAFVTGEAGVVCFVRTADCVPILMCDPEKGVVAAIHAGWKGTLLKIASKTVDRMVTSFGSERKNIVASIGPSISMNCYEVGPEVAGQFTKDHPQNVRTQNGKTFVDLQKTNRDILKSAGVDNVEIIPICNHCDKRFASYRRDKTDQRRQVNFIYSGLFVLSDSPINDNRSAGEK